MAREPQLIPDNQFPEVGISRSKHKQPTTQDVLPTAGWFTLMLASSADGITPWGQHQERRDQELRKFWHNETFLAGTVSTVSERNAAYEWVIKHKSDKIEEVVTDMLTASMAGDTFGWVPFMERISQDLLTQDNGAFIELIRNPVGNFTNERAPIVAINHLDSGRCRRTGNMRFPVVYIDKDGKRHKMPWYSVIPLSDYPSAIETMNGVGYCAVTRSLRLAQIMRSVMLYKDEKISGRHIKSLHVVGGVSRQELDDVMKREVEKADNEGRARYIGPALLASLDPEKPVSTATIDLAGLPDGFNFDEEMQWYITGLALSFSVDYQDLAPLPGGGIGGGTQAQMLHKKSTITGRAAFMRKITEAFRNYGVLPRGAEMVFTDKNEQEERERQEVRTSALEEYALAIRNGMMSAETARKDAVKRGIYDKWMLTEKLPEIFTGTNPLGQRGGNTMREDAGRTDSGKPRERVGDRLRKGFKEFLDATLAESKLVKEHSTLEKLIKAVGDFTIPPANITVNVPEQTPPKIVLRPQIKMPRVKKQTQRVIRNPKGDIERTETTMEYEDG